MTPEEFRSLCYQHLKIAIRAEGPFEGRKKRHGTRITVDLVFKPPVPDGYPIGPADVSEEVLSSDSVELDD